MGNIVILVLAIVLIGLVAFVPRLLQVRIRLLDAIGLKRLAQWHERQFPTIVLVIRVVIVTFAAILLFAALRA